MNFDEKLSEMVAKKSAEQLTKVVQGLSFLGVIRHHFGDKQTAEMIEHTLNAINEEAPELLIGFDEGVDFVRNMEIVDDKKVN